MTRYRITAPNGITYETDGPPNATPEQVKAVILKAHPEAANPAPAGAAPVQPTAQPAAQPAAPVPTTTAPSEGGGFFSELGRGLERGWEQVKNVPGAIQQQITAGGASQWLETLKLFDSVDAGTYTPPQEMSPTQRAMLAGMTPQAAVSYNPSLLGTGPQADAEKYAKASPEEKVALRQKVATLARRDVGEIVAGTQAAAQRAQEMAPAAPRVQNFTDINSLADVRDYLGSTAGESIPQLAAVLGTALVTRSAAATAGVSTGLAYAGGIEDRVRFAQEQVKDLPPAKQAEAIAKYLKDSADVTAMVAIASGALDLAGPAGGILKRQFVKELGGEVAARTAGEALKEGIKRAPREIGEEVLTGGAQEGVTIAGERALGEQRGDVMSGDNIRRVFNAAIAEGVGGGLGTAAITGGDVAKAAISKRVRTAAERELSRQAREAGIDLDEEAIGATYEGLVAKFVAEGVPESQALIQASRVLPGMIGQQELGTVESSIPEDITTEPAAPATPAEPAPAFVAGPEPVRAPLQEVDESRMAAVLPTIDADFAEYADDLATEYGVTELTPEVRTAAAEMVAASPGIAPIDAIGSVLERAQRNAPTPTVVPTATIDMSQSLKDRTSTALEMVTDVVKNDAAIAALDLSPKQVAMAKNQLARGAHPDARTAIEAVLNKTQASTLEAAAVEAPVEEVAAPIEETVATAELPPVEEAEPDFDFEEAVAAREEELLGEEFDYDSHPDIQANDSFFEDIESRLDDVETFPQLNALVNKLRKEEVLDEDYLDAIREATVEAEKGEKYFAARDALIDALSEVRDARADEIITNIDEELTTTAAERARAEVTAEQEARKAAAPPAPPAPPTAGFTAPPVPPVPPTAAAVPTPAAPKRTRKAKAKTKAQAPSKELQRARYMIAQSHSQGRITKGLSDIMQIERSTRSLGNLLRSIPGVITTKRGRLMLQFLTPADVIRLAKERSSALGRRLDKVASALAGIRNNRAAMLADINKQAYRWNVFNARYKDGGRILSDVMNLATLHDIDPRRAPNPNAFLAQDGAAQKILGDKTLGARAKNNRVKGRIELVNEVYAYWDQLAQPKNGAGEGRKIFDMAAKAYRATFERQLAATLSRIDNTTLSDARKAAAKKQVRDLFAEAEKIGLYFPLGREGDYWMRVGTGKEREYYQYPNQLERDAALRDRHDAMVAAGDRRTLDDILGSGEIITGDNSGSLQEEMVDNDATGMFQNVLNELDAGNLPDIKAVREQLTQMLLQTLPKPAQSAAMQRRQGVTGFNANTLRTFVTSQSAAASRLSRLEHGHKVRTDLATAYALIENDPDKAQLIPYVDQMAEFASAQMAPTQGHPWAEFLANAANRATFLYMMTGLKTAIIQPLQLSVTGMFVLNREYGLRAQGLALRYMLGFYNKLGTSKRDEDGNVITEWGQPSMGDSSYINEHPNPEMRRVLKAAWEGGNSRGLFNNNYTGDITGDRQLEQGKFDNAILGSTRKTLSFVHNFMTGAGFHTERMAHEIMYMSSFELEYAKLRKQGMVEAKAVERAEQKAADLTVEALFDYDVSAKPMIARGPLGRVVFQFATFAMNMSSLLVRNFYTAVRLRSSLQERRDASVMFFGMMGATYMWAGATGLPLYGMFMGLADVARELFRPLLEDEDEDPSMYDAESGNPMAYASMDLWFRQWFLPKYLGKGSDVSELLDLSEEQADALQRSAEMGPISAATDLNFGSSMSLNDMFFRDEQPAANVKDSITALLASMGLGASGSMATQMASGIDFMLEGKGDRAAEKLMPYNFLRQPMIASRLQREGYITARGDELKPAEFYTVGKLAGQLFGFGSTEVAEAQKRNILFSRATDKIEAERTKVTNRYNTAFTEYQRNPTDANMAKIEAALEDIDMYNVDNGAINPIKGADLRQGMETRAENRAVAEQLGGLRTDKKYRGFAADMLDR